MAVGLVATLAAAVSWAGPAPGADAQVTDEVRLNEIQVVGSHNSYHLEPSPEETAIIRAVDAEGADALEYSHLPLDQQFATQRVRQIELDVFADPEGGRYADPVIRRLAGHGPYDPAMEQPGTKVLHIQDIDYRTTCLSLVACLQVVEGWSDANPGHLPLAIIVEAKDASLQEQLGGAELPPLGFVDPLPFDTAAYDAVDAEIRSVFSDDELLTPDDVRGDRATLEEAILTDGWPTLEEARDQVLFLMDQGGEDRAAYLAGHPNLEGRVMFTNAEPRQPDAAFLKVNDPLGAGGGRVSGLVADGYLVRTRADEPTVQARSGDTTRRDAALASGAQFVSTDYPAPGIAARFGTDYSVGIPGGTVARCNPVNAPPGCVDAELGRIPVDGPPSNPAGSPDPAGPPDPGSSPGPDGSPPPGAGPPGPGHAPARTR